MPFHQAPDHLTVIQHVSGSMDIIPHGELRKTEIADDTGFDNIPSLQGIKCPSDYGECLFNIDTMSIGWQRVKSGNIKVIILLQHFKQCSIEMWLFVPSMKPIALVSRLPDYLNWKQNQRRIARYSTIRIRKPTHQTNSKVKTADTIFLLGCSGGTIDCSQLPIQLLLPTIGIQTMIPEFMTEFLVRINILI